MREKTWRGGVRDSAREMEKRTMSGKDNQAENFYAVSTLPVVLRLVQSQERPVYVATPVRGTLSRGTALGDGEVARTNACLR